MRLGCTLTRVHSSDIDGIMRYIVLLSNKKQLLLKTLELRERRNVKYVNHKETVCDEIEKSKQRAERAGVFNR